MSRPAYFIVQKTDLGLRPTIFWDEMPRERPRGIEYVVRLDELPGGDKLVERPLSELFGVYLQMKRRGNLPPQWQPPKRPPAPEEKRLLGHREVHPRRHLLDAPYEESQVKSRLVKEIVVDADVSR
jgi:hypothetical protein